MLFFKTRETFKRHILPHTIPCIGHVSLHENHKKIRKIHEGKPKKIVPGRWVLGKWLRHAGDDECLLVPCRSRSLKDQLATASLGSSTTNGRKSRTLTFFGVAESCFWVCFTCILLYCLLCLFLMNECHICNLIYNLLDIIVIFCIVSICYLLLQPQMVTGSLPFDRPRHIVFLRRSARIRVQTLSSSIVVCITHVALPTPCTLQRGKTLEKLEIFFEHIESLRWFGSANRVTCGWVCSLKVCWSFHTIYIHWFLSLRLSDHDFDVLFSKLLFLSWFPSKLDIFL